METYLQQVAAVIVATDRIATEHGAFNRIRQLAQKLAPKSNTWFLAT